MTRGKKFAGIVAVVAAGLVLAGCGANTRDLEGVPIKDPDKIEIYANLDQHPNIVRLCIGGVAFYTTTRDLNAIGRVPEWDAWCGNTTTK
jgi:hypothetical protein